MPPPAVPRPTVHLGAGDRLRLTAAWLLLGVSRLAILLLPFTVARRVLGENRDPRAAARDEVAVAPRELGDARRLGSLVQLAARRTPWRSECYPQALTARALLTLHRIPHVVSFGVRRDGDALVAHTWVHVGGTAVVGETGHAYTEVGTFSWTPRRRPRAGDVTT